MLTMGELAKEVEYHRGEYHRKAIQMFTPSQAGELSFHLPMKGVSLHP